MNNYNSKRNIEVSEIIAIIRVLFVFLIVYTLYSFIPQRPASPIISTSIIMVVNISLAVVIYLSWGYFLRTSIPCLRFTKYDIAFFIIEILIITLIIYRTGAHNSNYKNLYFIIIITNSIRFGSSMGIISSAISAVGIVFIDLVYQVDKAVNPYLEADLIIIITFFVTGWMLGTFMENEIKYRKMLSYKVITDEVTGLRNHRYFQEQLSAEVEHAKKCRQKLALIMIDLDYFKYYNDTYGHQQGDALLKEIGDSIGKSINNRGIVCRYGGDEFAVILKCSDSKDASETAESIRKAIDGKGFFGERNTPGSDVTASVGIAIYPDNALDKDELIKKADDAMYKAKYMSKNRVELYFSVLDELKSTLNESEQNLLNSIKTLITVINAKDRYTYGHSERVVLYATMIGQSIGMNTDDLRRLRYAAYLHDIGKIEISRDILNKEVALTEEEWKLLKNHPVWGADIVRPIEALKESIPAILYHHERYDGWGYPEGVKGLEIPLCARIMAVADSFDAMTTKRPYKPAKTLEEAVEELERCKGTQFDPDIVDIFTGILLTSGEQMVV